VYDRIDNNTQPHGRLYYQFCINTIEQQLSSPFWTLKKIPVASAADSSLKLVHGDNDREPDRILEWSPTPGLLRQTHTLSVSGVFNKSPRDQATTT